MWFWSPSEFPNNIHHVYTASYGGFGAQSIGAPYRRADRCVDRRVEWYRCLKLDMHIIWKYAYIDEPGVLGVQYIYVCMHVCMYYVCMYAIRRADRYSARWSACWVIWMCLKLNMHVLLMYVYIDAPIVLGVLYMYVRHSARRYRRADRRAVWHRYVPS